MRNKLFRSAVRVVPAFMLGLGVLTFSCKEQFDIAPENTLDHSQTYQNVFDADAAVIGVYGKFLNLAERHVVLNELRGDLINVTRNAGANADLLQLNYHHVTTANKYADPRPYYEVIINCNDVLKNFDRMVQENKMEQSEYAHRYSDIGALRSWVYLQLGIMFGEVPYVTEPLANVEELRDPARFPLLKLDQLLDRLIEFSEALPYKDTYASDNSLVVNIDGFNTSRFFINKRVLLGDLHLWKGNYTQAATHYRVVMETSTQSTNLTDFYNVYTGSYDVGFDPATGFNGVQSRNWTNEWVWSIPFSKNFTPVNPFINLFSKNGGSYLLKPSQEVIDKWDKETRTSNTPTDTRAQHAWQLQGGDPVVLKYLYNFNSSLPYEKPGTWFLTRATQVHLRFAEAANRDGRHKLAVALLDRGVRTTFDPTPGVSGRDVTNIMQTHDVAPYDFDARMGDNPSWRGKWHRNSGVRGRAGVLPISISPLIQDSTMIVENALIHESALELAFEGHRWQDLLRVAIRRNDPAFLADKIYAKLEKAGDPRAEEVRARLQDPTNWFLPFRWE